MRKKRRKSEKSQGIWTGCPNIKVLPFLRFSQIPSFYQNTITRNQGNFYEVREKSGKMKVDRRWPPCKFMVHKKVSNHDWTKTGSCEPTFMKLSDKRVLIKLTDGPFNTNSILCLFNGNFINERINQETLFCLRAFSRIKISFE